MIRYTSLSVRKDSARGILLLRQEKRNDNAPHNFPVQSPLRESSRFWISSYLIPKKGLSDPESFSIVP